MNKYIRINMSVITNSFSNVMEFHYIKICSIEFWEKATKVQKRQAILLALEESKAIEIVTK